MNKSLFYLVALFLLAVSAQATRPFRQFVTLPDGTEHPLPLKFMGCPSCGFGSETGSSMIDLRAFDTTGNDGLGIYGRSAKGILPSIGSPEIPVVMIDFPDLSFMEGTTMEKVDRIFNEEGYADQEHPNYKYTQSAGSVRDYYRFSSGGLFTPHFSVVAKVTATNNHSYYGKNSSATVSGSDVNLGSLVTEALQKAVQEGVDLSKFAADASGVPLVIVYFAGLGEHAAYGEGAADLIWPKFSSASRTVNGQLVKSYYVCNEAFASYKAADDYATTGNVIETDRFICGIGVMIHELGHALGLPDVYDTKYQTPERPTPAYWSVMDYGQYQQRGYKPMQFSAYERSCLGWLELKELPAEGEVSIQPMEGYIMRNQELASQYYILESRTDNKWYDEATFGRGMLLWQINYKKNYWSSNIPNNNLNEQCLHVVPADGVWQGTSSTKGYSGDLYPTDSRSADAPSYPTLNLYGNLVKDIHMEGDAVKMTHEGTEGIQSATTRPADQRTFNLNPWIRISEGRKILNR